MPLIRIDNAELHYGDLALLDGVDFQLARGQKVGLLGRNGAGKSTFLGLLAGDIEPDAGQRWLRPGTRLGRLEQDLPVADDQSVYDVVAGGLPESGRLLSEYHRLLQAGDNIDMNALARVQQRLEAIDGWQLQQRVESTLSRLSLPADTTMAALSGGWRRRVALARALVSQPDVLLMDEPTNHLDIPAIEWLEQQLQEWQGALVLVTHDRRFLQAVANVMAELDRGKLTTWEGDYQGFLKHREQQLQAEARANELFDRKLAEEEVWIRQGIKARRTRNEGRVRALEAMREERRQRRARTGTADFSLDDAGRSGKLVARMENVSLAYDGHQVIDGVSTLVRRGDRIGIVGPNGAGKTTLVRLLLGELAPDSGQVELGTGLEIAYSDQLRGQLDPEKDLIDNVCGGREFIDIGGRRRHAISYLGDFLFSPDRVRMPVGALSGGEQNRAVLARLFSRPVNLLVLDEPTNDLDMETLELLEEILLQFQGTVLLVSHDRAFMDQVVTSLMVLDGQGGVEEWVGGFSDWEAAGGRLQPLGGDVEPEPAAEPDKPVPQATQTRPTPARRKLSYKEQRELDALPARIEALEQRQQALTATMQDAEFFASGAERIQQVSSELADISEQLEAAIERWAELEE